MRRKVRLSSKHFFVLTIFLMYMHNAFSQIGIFTENPKASLDIIKFSASDTPDGILIPRLTGDEIESMVVNSDQNSLLVYATRASTATTPTVTSSGFWYYEANSSIWKPLGVESRKDIVTVNPDGSGDYKTLQEAYNGEAQKLYKFYTSGGTQKEFMEFRCTGDVGPLIANGVIPYIKIIGDNCNIGQFFVYSSSVVLEGTLNVTANTTFVNSFFKMNQNTSVTFRQLSLKKALFEVNIGCNIQANNIVLEQSSMNITSWSTNPSNITFLPSANVTAGLSLQFSSVKTGISSTLSFEGSYTFTDYISCDDSSFLSAQGTINANAPVSNSIVLSRQASKASMGTIQGAAVPNKIFHALTGGKIEHFRGSINMNTGGPAFLVASGGEIILGGDAVDNNSVLNGVNATYSGITADGGEVKLSAGSNSYTYTFNGYAYALRAASGGKIVTLGKVLQGSSGSLANLTPATFSSNGSVIFTGN